MGSESLFLLLSELGVLELNFWDALFHLQRYSMVV